MKNEQFLKEKTQKILESSGHSAIDAWSDAVKEAQGDVLLIRKIHDVVGKHLSDQIQETFNK